MLRTLRLKANQLKKQVGTLMLAYTHPKTPWYAKVWLLLVISYAMSPIDLIPDFIPILGLLDDLMLIPLGIAIAIRIIPKSIWEECKEQAENGVTVPLVYRSIGTAVIILLWVVVLAVLIRLLANKTG
jgi:uncharacterized membrane protein YkvA (DUF1232 family)